MKDKIDLIGRARTVTLLRGYVVELAEQVDELSKQADNTTGVLDIAKKVQQEAERIDSIIEMVELHGKILQAFMNMPAWIRFLLRIKL